MAKWPSRPTSSARLSTILSRRGSTRAARATAARSDARRTAYRWSKRALDLTVGVTALVVLAPLLALIAVLVVLDSPGPILYRQWRLGRGGPFTMYKFRSMHATADPLVHREHVTRLITENRSPDRGPGARATLKLLDDPRVTRVGRVLRKTSLDELPQLYNVLRGDMSLVGPRPCLPYEAEVYQEWHRARLTATPGMTGLWQVAGRNRVSFDGMIRMDLEYMHRQSLWLDVKILLRTPWAVLSGRGAG